MSSPIPTSTVGDGLIVSKITAGCWQLAGGHGDIDHAKFAADMAAHVEAGITTFDTADIYGPSEGVVGKFFQSRSADSNVVVTTKYCRGQAGMALDDVRKAINKSRKALGADALDLVAMHWWDFNDNGDVAVGKHLATLIGEGLLKNVAVTNYDLEHLQGLIAGGVPVAANQVQFSLLDRRPLDSGMAEWCRANNVGLFTYGSVGGGFLSDRWLGRGAPQSRGDVPTSSLSMYLTSIKLFGSWELFQTLLKALRAVADRHAVTIAAVAIRWVLEQPGVASVVVGMRDAKNVPDNVLAFSFELSDADKAEIAVVLEQATPSRGDAYHRERGM